MEFFYDKVKWHRKQAKMPISMPSQMLCKPSDVYFGIEIEEKRRFRCHVFSSCAPQKKNQRSGAQGLATKTPKKAVFVAIFNFHTAKLQVRAKVNGQEVCGHAQLWVRKKHPAG